MKHRFWADYTARDFAALDRENLVAVLPVGAIEQHGPHLPLSVDRTILDGIIAAAIPRIPDDCPALFLPTIPVGKSNEHLRYPGTLTFSAATQIAMLLELGACVARAGVRKLMLLNSHGGQIAPLDIVARDLRVEHGLLTAAANWFAMGLPDGVIDEGERRFGIHAGEMETAVMLALSPDLVAMDRAQDFRPLVADMEGDYRLLGLSPAAKLGWQAQDMHPAGACGNAAAATVETGRAVIDHAAAQLVAALEEMARAPLAWLDAEPGYAP